MLLLRFGQVIRKCGSIDFNAVGAQLNAYITKTVVSHHRTLLKCYKIFGAVPEVARASKLAENIAKAANRNL